MVEWKSTNTYCKKNVTLIINKCELFIVKYKKYHTVGTVPIKKGKKRKRKIVERCKIDTPNIHIHDL